MTPQYQWMYEKSVLLGAMKEMVFPKFRSNSPTAKFMRNVRNPNIYNPPYKTLEDPFTHEITIQCCKENFNLPKSVYEFLKTANTTCEDHIQYAVNAWEIIEKHSHLDPCQRQMGFKVIPGTNFLFCVSCKKHNPFPIFNTHWLHECRKNEWAVNSPNKKPTIKWHMQAQCWTFAYTYHNLLDNFLRMGNKTDVSRDEKSHLWLISDQAIAGIHAHIKNFLPDVVWMQNTKRTPPPGRVQISTTALHAETVLSFLPKDELKALIRKTFMNLHPDRGGDHDQFVKFKLALEGWEKK